MQQKITMPTQQNHSITLEELLRRFIRKCKVKNLTEKSIISYEDKLKWFIQFCGKNNPVDQITADIVDDYILYLRENHNANDVTINSYLRSLRALLYFAMDNGQLERFKITLPKAEKKAKRIYTDEQLKILLKRPDMNTCSFSQYRAWTFINYLLGTGNRLSTALNVRIEDINFQDGLITLRKMKNRKQQIIPLSSTLSSVLQEYLEIRGGEPGDYLFCNAYGQQACNRSYQSLIRRYNLKRGVDFFSIHGFRHTFASQWIKRHGDVGTLSRILGHSSIAVTNEYVHLFGSDLAPDFDKFNPLDNICK